jgi:DNA-binding NarL/FixJ family response regulator
VANTVLLVDDNPMVRDKIKQIFELNHLDCNVAEASNGREGVEKAAELVPDLVVLDFAMPVMNGLEAATRMKRNNPQLPLILFTAHKDTYLEKQAFNNGVSVVMSKTDPDRLIASARFLLKHGAWSRTGIATERKFSTGEVIRAKDTQPKTDLRHESRTAIDVEATMFSDRHGFLPARVADLSNSGLAAVLPVELNVGDVVTVRFRVPEGVRNIRAVLRNRNAFRHGFEILQTSFPSTQSGKES